MGKLNLWTGILGVEQIKREQLSHMKNREAEDSHVRKTVWGYEEGGRVNSEEDMGTVILGDNIQNPAPVIQQPPPQNSVLPVIAAALLGAAVPAAGVVGYLASRQPAPAVTPSPPQSPSIFNDESLSVGLGRYEDYFSE